MRRIIFLLTLLPMMAQAQTLEECQQAAERNYPLIRRYELIKKSTEMATSNLQKGWLPQISASAQATLQSDVMSWPDKMQTMFTTMGVDIKGAKKDQYKVGVDAQQMLYDGGMIKNQKEIARQQGEVQSAQNEVDLYHVRKRVNDMYFGLLLIDDQLKMNADLQNVLKANEDKLASMLKGGTAAKSDYQSVKAERLNAVQQRTELEVQRQTFIRMLSLLCGIEITKVTKPESITLSTQKGQRPELKAIDMQLKLADTRERALDAALKPKLGIFAQGYYGYPGYNMLESMRTHKFSWNGMIGVRLSWNIGALYTYKNDKNKIRLQREMAENNRDVFLLNNRLEQIQQDENIGRYRKLMVDDEELITLRSSIRKAAESKLIHGIIDVNDLVKEINNENTARVQQTMHEVQMLKVIYDRKYTRGE